MYLSWMLMVSVQGYTYLNQYINGLLEAKRLEKTDFYFYF